MKKITNALIVALAASAWSWSCVNRDYDLEKIDTDNITLFGDSLLIPLGSTEPKTLKELLDGEAGFVSFDPVTGLMSIRFDGGNTTDVNIGHIGDVSIDGVNVPLKLPGGDELNLMNFGNVSKQIVETIDFPAITVAGSTPVPVTPLTLNGNSIAIDLPDEIYSVNSVAFVNDGTNTVTLQINVPSNISVEGGNGIWVHLDPAMTVTDTPAGYVTDNGDPRFPLKDGVNAYTFKVTRIDFSQPIVPSGGTFDYPVKFKLDGEITASASKPSGGSIQLMLEINNAQIATATFTTANVNHAVHFNDNIPAITVEGIPSQITSVSRIAFSGTQQLTLKLDPVKLLPSGKTFLTKPRADLVITLPDFIHVRNGASVGHTITLTDVELPLERKFDIVKIEFATSRVPSGGKIILSASDLGYGVDGAIRLAGQKFTDISGLGVETEIGSVDISTLSVGSVVGVFDLSGVAPGHTEVSLEGIDKIRNIETRLSFDNPALNLSVDLGDGVKLPIPLEAEFKLTPSAAGVAGSPLTVPLKLSTDRSRFAFTVRPNGVFLDDVLQTTRQIDINGLFAGVPDKIDVDYTVVTGTGQQEINLSGLTPGGIYSLTLGYGMPLTFDENFAIAFSDTVSFDKFDDETVDMLFHAATSRIELGCEVENSIPLQLKLVAIPCDGDYAQLPLVKTSPSVLNPAIIASGGPDNSPRTSMFTVSLSGDRDQLKRLRNVVFRFVATPGTGQSGSQLSGDGWLKLRAWGKLVGGIHIKD